MRDCFTTNPHSWLSNLIEVISERNNIIRKSKKFDFRTCFSAISPNLLCELSNILCEVSSPLEMLRKLRLLEKINVLITD